VIAAGGDEQAVAVGYALVTAAGFLAVVVMLRGLLHAVGGGSRDAHPVPADGLAGEFWRFALPRALGQTCNVAVLWLDTLLIAAWHGSTDAGIYAAGTRYLLIGTFTAEAVMNAVGPRVSGLLTRGERDGAQAVVTEATVWQAALITPVYLVIGIFAGPLLAIFGPGYDRAAPALVVLSVGMLVAGLCGPADSVVLMSGRSRLSLQNSLAALAVNIVGNVVLTTRYGLTGAGIAWAATLVVAYGLPVRQARERLGITTRSATLTRQVVLAVVAVGGTAIAARVVIGNTLPAAIAAAVVGGGAYAATTWFRREAFALRAFGPRPPSLVPSTH
jgi:O-antigen/teichoic acid export membrane protein